MLLYLNSLLNGLLGFYFGGLDTVGGSGFGDTIYFPVGIWPYHAIMISISLVLFSCFA